MHVLTYPCVVDLVALKREILEIRRMPIMGVYTKESGETCLVFAEDPNSDEKLIIDVVVSRTRKENRVPSTFEMERRGE